MVIQGVHQREMDMSFSWRSAVIRTGR